MNFDFHQFPRTLLHFTDLNPLKITGWENILSENVATAALKWTNYFDSAMTSASMNRVVFGMM